MHIIFRREYFSVLQSARNSERYVSEACATAEREIQI